MTTVERKKSGNWPWLFLLIIILTIAWALLPTPSIQSDHAVESHLTDAITAMSNCTPDNSTGFYNNQTQRAGYVCETEEGKWGIIIFCAITGTVITAFIKNKMKKRDQVERYMENAGYKKM